MWRASILTVLARSPFLVVGLLLMIVGFHFLGALGFWTALGIFLLFSLLMGHLERARHERAQLRAMIDRDELR